MLLRGMRSTIQLPIAMYQRLLCLFLLFFMTAFLYYVSDITEIQNIEEMDVSILDSNPEMQLKPLSKKNFTMDHYGIPEFKCLDRTRFERLYSIINQTRNKIWTEWDVSQFPLFLSLIDVPKRSWEIQKNKYIRLILEEDKNKTYVVGFSGSSVTAGHDNFFREAYPQVFHDVMAPIFHVIGVKLEVRNQALGNNPCYPYDACVATHMVSA